MKRLSSMLAVVVASMMSASAHHPYTAINSYADAIVFDEMGITFSVYPDGEFDFYMAPSAQTTTVSNGFVNVTFNSGYNYNPFVQYDDYGAVVQVENVPVYYDWYGRVNQIGDVLISYRNRRVCQVGGLYVHYNNYGQYAYTTGYINVWNPFFVYRPFYVAFIRPSICFVNVNPYRQYYSPVRYTYYRPYVQNIRPCYATVGHTYSPSGNVVTVHHRYAQTPRAGEMAVVRERARVTASSARPTSTSVNRGSVQQRPVQQAPVRTGQSERTTVNSGYQRPTTSGSRDVSRSTSSSTTGSRPTTVTSERGNANDRSTMSRPSSATAPRTTQQTQAPASRPVTNTTQAQRPAVNSTTARTNGSSQSVGRTTTQQSRPSSSNTVSRSSGSSVSRSNATPSNVNRSSGQVRSTNSGSVSRTNTPSKGTSQRRD